MRARPGLTPAPFVLGSSNSNTAVGSYTLCASYQTVTLPPDACQPVCIAAPVDITRAVHLVDLGQYNRLLFVGGRVKRRNLDNSAPALKYSVHNCYAYWPTIVRQYGR